jgi:hypothetical protein
MTLVLPPCAGDVFGDHEASRSQMASVEITHKASGPCLLRCVLPGSDARRVYDMQDVDLR